MLSKNSNPRLHFICNLSLISCLQIFKVVDTLCCSRVHLVSNHQFLRCTNSSKLTAICHPLLFAYRVHLLSSFPRVLLTRNFQSLRYFMSSLFYYLHAHHIIGYQTIELASASYFSSQSSPQRNLRSLRSFANIL